MRQALIILTALISISLAGQGREAKAEDCSQGASYQAYAGEKLIPQNWNCEQRQQFWFTDQGSQIIPYAWFLHLEQAESQDKFSDPENMDRYRYLPQNPGPLNPDGLPIGFTRGSTDAKDENGQISKNWLGLTCAACHTARIEYGDSKYLIEGAPTMGDFESLFRDLVSAMQATRDNADKFDRFAAAVIAENQERDNGGATDADALREDFKKMLEVRDEWNKRNQGTAESGDYGPARLDAVGSIFNEVAMIEDIGDRDRVRFADAPVSYPYLWDTPQHDRIQWNGIIYNPGLGALTRNIGEVLGVFGTLNLSDPDVPQTSIDFGGLALLENLARELQSPKWADTGLPRIDVEKARRGRRDFQVFCSGCHQPIERDDPDRRVEARLFRVAVSEGDRRDTSITATDPTMAANFLHRQVASGGGLSLAVREAMLAGLIKDSKAFLQAVMAGQPNDVVSFIDKARKDHLGDGRDPDGVKRFFDAIREEYKPQPDPNVPRCADHGADPCYKARPLNGIWATAPYLHNGSVRTMRQLLLPADQREKTFKVGTRQYDPNELGFKNDGSYVLDTRRPGNSNAGHDGPLYGNEILAKDKDRMDALLEYLKTL